MKSLGYSQGPALTSAQAGTAQHSALLPLGLQGAWDPGLCLLSQRDALKSRSGIVGISSTETMSTAPEPPAFSQQQFSFRGFLISILLEPAAPRPGERDHTMRREGLSEEEAVPVTATSFRTHPARS